MQLMMYIDNDLIESIPLDMDRIRVPGYLGNFKRKLKAKYKDLINECLKPPEFLVVNPFPPAKKPEDKS